MNLLISSNIARYLEFKAVDETLIFNGHALEAIPCSKQGLLLNTTIPLRDKRLLSKFIQQVMQFNASSLSGMSTQRIPAGVGAEGSAISSFPNAGMSGPRELSSTFADYDLPPNASFGALLTAASLSPDVQGYVLHAMAGVRADVPWPLGIQKMQMYLQSIGVHGPTPFIVPIYGNGELAQAFCRLAAVFGGIYMLNTSAKLSFNENGVLMGVDTAHGCMHAPLVVVSPPASTEHVLYRAVVIAEGSCGRKENASLVTLPPDSVGSEAPISVIVLGSGVYACPPGYSIVHLTMRDSIARRNDARAALERAARVFVQWPDESVRDERSTALFAIFFQLPLDRQSNMDSHGEHLGALFSSSKAQPLSTNTADILVEGCIDAPLSDVISTTAQAPRICHMRDFPDSSPDFQDIANEAESTFVQLQCGEAFLPAAPNPEDVIWGDGNDGGLSEDDGEGEQVQNSAAMQTISDESKQEENGSSETSKKEIDGSKLGTNFLTPLE